MISFCNGCKKNVDFRDIKRWVAPAKEHVLLRFCRSCISGTVTIHDVFWDGKPEEGLADDPATGKPRVFSSKFEKSAYLKARGLQEAGDTVHGAPYMFHKNQDIKTDPKHEVQMALKKVREMGRDNRRQEFLRIQKQGERYA